jgi:hypothetical protein
MIRAEVHGDDHRAPASFDATPFFGQATLEDIQGLRAVGWGGDYEADRVAQFMGDQDGQVARVFHHLSFGPARPGSTDPVGFESHVCEEDVARRVKASRPDWFGKVWPDGIDVSEPPDGPDQGELWGDE